MTLAGEKVISSHKLQIGITQSLPKKGKRALVLSSLAPSNNIRTNKDANQDLLYIVERSSRRAGKESRPIVSLIYRMIPPLLLISCKYFLWEYFYCYGIILMLCVAESYLYLVWQLFLSCCSCLIIRTRRMSVLSGFQYFLQ